MKVSNFRLFLCTFWLTHITIWAWNNAFSKNSDNEIYISPICLVSYNIKIKFLSQARFPNYFNEVWSTSISTIISLLLLPIFFSNSWIQCFSVLLSSYCQSWAFCDCGIFSNCDNVWTLVTCMPLSESQYSKCVSNLE